MTTEINASENNKPRNYEGAGDSIRPDRQGDIRYLHDGWVFGPADSTNTGGSGRLANVSIPKRMPAEVPGTVHTDLMKNGVIDDPCYRDNEYDLQWIGERDWIYHTEFRVDQELLQHRNIELVFEGLDTWAEVYLNDRKILTADNMFRTWRVDVSDHLTQGKNQLEIRFNNYIKVNKPKWDAAPYRLQAVDNNDQAEVKLSVYSRKAGFHFGWDWGPRLVTCGLWRPVSLQVWDDFKITSVHFQQAFPEEQSVEITAVVEAAATRSQEVSIDVRSSGQVHATEKVTLREGTHCYPVRFRIKDPKLWWCNGLGNPHRYTFIVEVKGDTGLTDRTETRIGIRKLRLVRDEDDAGRSFYFELNGRPVFIKGANYIPQDNFQNRVTPERCETLIRSAAEVHMNMLRVWGGGIYEEDHFYELCDQYGILIWQDLMFACGMYPSDEDFLESVWLEVRDNVRRLRNYACIAVWCGNNENEMLWHLMWKSHYSSDQQKQYEHDMHKLFYDTIPNAIREDDRTRDYVPTSPTAGFAGRAYKTGSLHYWDVWHGREPFENYRNHIGRFMTEYGFQSFPDLESVNRFSIADDHDIGSRVMEAHQRCMEDERRDRQYGNRLIAHYMERYFRTPKDFSSFLLVSQLLQAKGMAMAIESHRVGKSDRYCMGTMFWQLNDCWPAISWSSVDYYGRWKALHYHLKKIYGDLLIVVRPEDGDDARISFNIVSDLPYPLTGCELKMTVRSFGGDEVSQQSMPLDIAAERVVKAMEFRKPKLTGNQDEKQLYIRAELHQDRKLQASQLYFFVNEKDLALTDPGLSYEMLTVAGGYRITLHSRRFAKNVYLSLEGVEHHCSDNFFDMEPGETKEVVMKTSGDVPNVEKKVRVISLIDTY